jgi:hypothetical protein
MILRWNTVSNVAEGKERLEFCKLESFVISDDEYFDPTATV